MREHRLIRDARELVKGGVIYGGRKRGGTLESILTGVFAEPHCRTASSRYLVQCDDTLTLRSQPEVKHRMKLGTMLLTSKSEAAAKSTKRLVCLLGSAG
jgi:hypothetical protein